MPVNKEQYLALKQQLDAKGVVLVAVSKTKPVEDILQLYALGHRDFGENYVQELVEKQAVLPPDIRWHFIGHLQTNKVKAIVPFVYLIHSVDSFKLLKEIGKQAQKLNRVQNVLLQLHIASEETKFGLSEAELEEMVKQLAQTPLLHVHIKGFMGMASFTNDQEKIEQEFRMLKTIVQKAGISSEHPVLSFGMSADYTVALQEGSTMIRIGSLLFGNREKKP